MCFLVPFVHFSVLLAVITVKIPALGLVLAVKVLALFVVALVDSLVRVFGFRLGLPTLGTILVRGRLFLRLCGVLFAALAFLAMF